MVIVVAETQQDRLNSASLESIAAAGRLGSPIAAIVLGDKTSVAAETLSRSSVSEVIRLEHPLLEGCPPDATIAALAALIGTMAPSHVVCAHTYHARNYVPRLAARLDRALLTDCIAIAVDGEVTRYRRPLFQGKVVADVVLNGPAPHFVCVQVGAFRADGIGSPATPAPIRVVAASLADADLKQSVEPPFREAKQDVDLSTAQRIVAAGRGIKEESQLAIVRQLASVLGAEVAGSRPLCDAGWLPLDRQIGSSGQTVAPQLYLALGISGAIQHIVGMKGSKTIVAINTDADAPIFEIADYGIVGDLFEVVPALIAALETR
jgi:electron transfer flavoprotein alpha subunit